MLGIENFATLYVVSGQYDYTYGPSFIERIKEIPYKEGRMKDIGTHVGYTVLWDTVSKVVEDGDQMCY